jgi:hypothetical protein
VLYSCVTYTDDKRKRWQSLAATTPIAWLSEKKISRRNTFAAPLAPPTPGSMAAAAGGAGGAGAPTPTAAGAGSPFLLGGGAVGGTDFYHPNECQLESEFYIHVPTLVGPAHFKHTGGTEWGSHSYLHVVVRCDVMM